MSLQGALSVPILASMASDLQCGAVVGEGRFVIIAELGRGSQAQTFVAQDQRGGPAIALKRFLVSGASSWKDVELAEREAVVLEGLSHPLLPTYVTHFEEDGALYLALEKIEGQSLKYLQGNGGLHQSEVLRFLTDMATIFDYLHTRSPPIIHRDVKPGNVIRRSDGRFVLVDFGSVSHRLRPEGGSTVVGTFGYMAPEQFQGRALAATDTYGAAATALAMLTGLPPEVLPHRGLSIDVDAALGAGHSDALKQFLKIGLSPDPDERGQATLTQLLRRYQLLVTEDTGSASAGAVHRGAAEPAAGDATSGDPSSAAVSAAAEYDLARFGAAVPWVKVVMLMALTAMRLVVLVVMLVAIPLFLNLLSLVFGPGPRRAARAVREGGREVRSALASVRVGLAAIQLGPGVSRPGRRESQRAKRLAKASRFEKTLEHQTQRAEREVESFSDEIEREWGKRRNK